MKRGTRCKLLHNPPKHHSAVGGDKFDGVAIAVSPQIMEYHAIGSVIQPCEKHPRGGVWIHIYNRISRKSDTFKYTRSFPFDDSDRKASSEQANRDQKGIDRFMGG